MAKVVDPDNLVLDTDVTFDTTLKTITISIGSAITDDSPGKTSGVTGQCIYSFAKEEWKAQAALNKFKFPIKMIYAASFQLINGWKFSEVDSDQSRDVIRDAGFQESILADEYSCIISLGAIDSTPTAGAPYYANVEGFDQVIPVSNFDKNLELNENIIVYDGATDTRDYLKLFLREYSKLYAEYDLHFEQGLSAISYEAYKLPLSNSNDAKIVNEDTFVSGANNPYQNMSIDYLHGTLFDTHAIGSYTLNQVVQNTADGRWYRNTIADTTDNIDVTLSTNFGTNWEIYPGERQIGDNWYAFNRIVDGDSVNTATVSQAHTFCQWSLRQATDINGDAELDGFGTVLGNVAIPLTAFIGDQMHTNPGVYIDYTHADDNSNITYWDITVDGGGVDPNTFVPISSTELNNPFFSSFTLVFSDNLLAEGDNLASDTQFRMYFTNDLAADTPAGNDFDTAGAIVVQEIGLTDITDTISTAQRDAGDYTFQYAYDTNIQRGAGSLGKDAPVTISFQGLDGSEISTAEFTITRSTGLTFTCNTPDELNYNNPL